MLCEVMQSNNYKVDPVFVFSFCFFPFLYLCFSSEGKE